MNDDAPQTSDNWWRRIRAWSDDLSDRQWALLRFCVAALGAGALACAAFFIGTPAWRDWRHRAALRQAVSHAERQDQRGTMLALQRAAELAPLDLTTWREVSRRLAELGSPQAVLALENTVRLAPGDVSLRLALVAEALRFGQTDTADAALRGLDESMRADASFHRLAAALAMATGEAARLEEHIAAFAAAAPDDAVACFNLAALRSWSLETAKRDAAFSELERLTSEPAVRVRAALELLKHAAQTQDPARARHVVDLLLQRLGTTASPASVPAASDTDAPRGWNELVRALQIDAARSGGTETELVARWMGDVRLGKDALAWIDSLPAALRDSLPVQGAALSLGADALDYVRIADALGKGALGPVPAETVPLAIASRVQLLHYQEIDARATWRDAIASCRGDPSALSALASLAELWRDPVGNEQVLLAVLALQPQATWVYEALRNNYLARGATQKLWQLYEKWSRNFPANAAVTRARLTLGAVLDEVSPEAADLALRRAAATDSAPYDHALAAAVEWRRKNMLIALSQLDAISAPASERADVAFWIAVIGAASDVPKYHEAARTALVNARRPGLSAEETALLDKSARQLQLR